MTKHINEVVVRDRITIGEVGHHSGSARVYFYTVVFNDSLYGCIVETKYNEGLFGSEGYWSTSLHQITKIQISKSCGTEIENSYEDEFGEFFGDKNTYEILEDFFVSIAETF